MCGTKFDSFAGKTCIFYVRGRFHEDISLFVKEGPRLPRYSIIHNAENDNESLGFRFQ